VDEARDRLIVDAVRTKAIDLKTGQRRRRFLLVASKVPKVDPASILKRLATGIPDHPHRTVRWAIGDLLGASNGAGPQRGGG